MLVGGQTAQMIALGLLLLALYLSFMCARRRSSWLKIAAPVALLVPCFWTANVYLGAFIHWRQHRAAFLSAQSPVMYDGQPVYGTPVPESDAVRYEFPNGRVLTLRPDRFSSFVGPPVTQHFAFLAISLSLSLITYGAGRATARRRPPPEDPSAAHSHSS